MATTINMTGIIVRTLSENPFITKSISFHKKLSLRLAHFKMFVVVHRVAKCARVRMVCLCKQGVQLRTGSASDCRPRGVELESKPGHKTVVKMDHEMSQLMRLWYLSHRRPAKAQASLRTSGTILVTD